MKTLHIAKLLFVTLLFVLINTQLPPYPDRLAIYNIDGRKNFNPTDTKHKWDFIVVGAGAAGCVMANRLSKNNKVNVLLLDAGGSDVDFMQHMPAGFANNFNTEREFKYYSVEQTDSNNRTYKLPAGKGLGGTTSMNAMVYNRPTSADFDQLAANNPGWSWNDVLPFFKKTENNLNDSLDITVHGHGGEWFISEQTYTHDSMRQLHKAHIEAGIDEAFDQSDGSTIPSYTKGKSRLVQTFIYYGERQSLAEAMLKPTVVARKNLYVQTYANVYKILIENNKAVGVVYNQTLFARDSNDVIIMNPVTNLPAQVIGYELRTVYVSKSAGDGIVLSAGALNTPKVLLLSGIGPEDELTVQGITPVLNLPGVGKNAHDHAMFPLVFCLKNTTDSLDFETNDDNAPLNVYNWIIHRGTENALQSLHPETASPVSSNIPEHIAFIKRDGSNNSYPDYQTIAAPVTFVLDGTVSAKSLNQTRCLSFGPVLLDPKSKGYVKLRSSNPLDAPIIDMKYLNHPDDMDLMVEGFKMVRHIANQTSLASIIEAEVLPGSSVQSDAQIKEAIRTYMISGYHFAGSAKMGPSSDIMSVVDNNAKVYGLMNLYIVDASILPFVPRSNPTSVIVMAAEKIAHTLNRENNCDCEDGPQQGKCRHGHQQ